MTDPKTLDDDELKRRLRWAIMPTDRPATQDEKRFNVAALNEYIERKLTDYVIDDFIEFLGMSRL
jgi:hypothetical protein